MKKMHLSLPVLPGLVNAFVVFSPEFGGKPMGLPLESWIVENVSRGGFGATIQDIKGDWLKVGALLSLQPEGAENWVVGVVRRYHRLSEQEAQVAVVEIVGGEMRHLITNWLPRQ